MGPGIAAVAKALSERARVKHREIVPTNIPGLEVSWAWNPYPGFDDENNLSVVLFLNIHGFTFMFPGDMETSGFNNLLDTCPAFGKLVGMVDVLTASHHGRANGICPAMFDKHGCKPQIVVISDDYKQYDTQNTTDYYASKARGIAGFRGGGRRFVLTTRKDGEILFQFKEGTCTVL